MALETYRKKRDFASTPEPKGRKGRKAGQSFVVQKHDATRLHYDFRLEMEGVLKSWAVTRGPSLDPGEKRLAVHVEDHPLEYGDFEGTIPKGEYGGGTVIVWDRGTWTPIGDARKGYAKGHLDFELEGDKLRGRWHLVRMHGKPREKRENWLLIKGDDAFARPDGKDDLLNNRPESVKTGRQIADVAGEAPGWSSRTGRIRRASGGTKSKAGETGASAAGRGSPQDPSRLKGARKAAMPAFIEPMLATLGGAPSGDRWVHEIKFDGYRLQARIEAGRVKLLTRGNLDWTRKFGKNVVDALRDLPLGAAIIDGELVVPNDAGASDFSALQADLSEGRNDRFVFYVFDLLYLDGFDLTRASLAQRKALLHALAPAGEGILRYSPHFEDDGTLVLQHACRLSLEGVVSKLKDAPYRSGRGKSWIKSKCSARQEFVIGGFVPSSVSRKAIGSLVLGVYEDNELHHVGRVGTGFTIRTGEELYRRLNGMRATDSPFSGKLTADEARGVKYVRPDLVAEIEFRAWTADGHLRHASFRGLREDKDARDVLREAAPSRSKAQKPQRRSIKLTHPERVYWPDQGITKEGLADYYADVWTHIAPFIVGRPLALLRCPAGIAGETFFQKHVWRGASDKIASVADPTHSGEDPLIVINDLDGLLALVQGAALEIHPWGSTVAELDRPDTIILDLDPGAGVAWEDVILAAEEVRRRLSDAGLAAFVKTSGGKGLHVVAPLKPKADWTVAKAFTKALADSMASDSPDRYVSTIAKAKRHGRILIDYLRNQRGQTAVAAYSTRARPGAAVSTPLSWSELGPGIGPAYFTLENLPTRLAALKRDPWDGFRGAAAPLEQRRSKRAA